MSNIIPGLQYHDAPAAIDWLFSVFGFSEHLVVPGENGAIAHAQLVLGSDMIMLGSMPDDESDQRVRPPSADGVNTQSAYVVVEEIDANYQHAKASGTEIVIEIADQEYGGRLYAALDPEGHLWHFGSYNPWA